MIKNGTHLKDTKKFISEATCMSFLRPLFGRIGNLTDKEGFWTSQNDRKRTSGCLFTDELLSKKTRVRNLQSAIHNQKGIALVMVLILSAIALAIMAGLIYMITTGTQISGMQKRYKTALEAGMGGADITYQFIASRGETSGTNTLLSDLSAISPTITTPNTCITLSTNPSCTAIGSYTGLATKLNLPTSCWSGCDSSLTITPPTPSGPDNTTYDMRFDLGTSPFPTYRAFAKIVDTVEGNSGGDEGLLGRGVVSSGAGEVTVVSKPYLYTIEVDAQDQANPSERAKLSILYQY